MAQYELEIKEASSSLAKLVFVKIPDNAFMEKIESDKIIYSDKKNHEAKRDYHTVSIPKTLLKYKFVGYSHNLKDNEILEHFSSEKEYYNLLSYHDILYNYSAWTGKWAVLAVDNSNN